MWREEGGFRPGAVLALLALLAAVAALCFMTLGARGSWSFVLTLRGTRLAGLALVAHAVAVATVLFQTVTNNRILTPSIMGFDALYMLLQTVFVFALGAAAVSALEPRLLFVVELAAMTGFSLLLYRLLFSGAVRSLHLLMLVGIVFGILFRGLSGFLQRIVNPDDFVVLQDRLFASFNGIDPTLIGISALLIAAVSLVVWRLCDSLDVMALGRDSAISLGLDHRRLTLVTLVLVTVLVSVSTALVGPVAFFGLLVANLAYLVMPSMRHRDILPAAVLIALICLIGGQTLLERVFAFDTALAIVIEFVGGIFFIAIVLRGSPR